MFPHSAQLRFCRRFIFTTASGGIQGFVGDVRCESNGQVGNSDFTGLGWLFALAESFLILFVIFLLRPL